MALALAYQNTPQKQVYDTIIVAHFDSHGVATAAARARLLRQQGQRVRVYSRFPATGPTPQFPQFVDELRSQVEAKVAEVIDIPVNVKSPDLHIDAEARLPATQIFHYDHHETSIPFAQRLAARGIIPVIVANAVQMAAALGLLGGDATVRDLALIGITADRDPSILSVVDRATVEQRYVPLANKLDILVRQPNLVNANDQGSLAEMLAEYGVAMLEQANVQYPPYTEASKAAIIAEGDIAVLYDAEQIAPMWQPKTAEVILQRTGKHYAVFVAPAQDPRTRQQIGWDVRVLQYWLSELKPEPETIVRDIIARYAAQGNVVGHGRYVSVRLEGVSKEQAIELAREIYRRIEGRLPTTAHLVNDNVVAEAVRRDYQKLYQLLERIARALERGSEAKERQVQLLEQLYERDERTRYD